MYYATIERGGRRGLLAGPFLTHGAALRAVPHVRAAAQQANPAEASFASYGTARTKDGRRTPGKLNHLIPAQKDYLP